MKEKNEFYLVALSILLASSLLKSTEIFQLGGQLKDVVFIEPTHITTKIVGAYCFLASFILFFFFAGLTISGAVWQMSKDDNGGPPAKPRDLGPLVYISVWLLIISHLIAFGFMANSLHT
jgi:hypothetical protein